MKYSLNTTSVLTLLQEQALAHRIGTACYRGGVRIVDLSRHELALHLCWNSSEKDKLRLGVLILARHGLRTYGKMGA